MHPHVGERPREIVVVLRAALVAQLEQAPDSEWEDDTLPDDLAALLDAVFLDAVPAARRMLERLEQRGWTGWTKIRRIER